MNLYATAAGVRDYLAIGVMHHDRAAAGMQPQIAAHRAHIDPTAASLGVGASANVIEMHAAAAALRFHAAGNARGVHVAAFGFELNQQHFTGNVDRDLAGKMPRLASALPIAHDPGSVTLHVGGYFVLLKLAARVLLGRGFEVRMNDIINALLLPPPHHHRAHVDFHSQVLHRRQRASDLLTPGFAFAGHVGLLRPALRNKGQRRKQSQHSGEPNNL